MFFVALNLDFFLPRLVPGNAAEIFSGGTKLPAADVLLLEQRFGLNQPLYTQYYLFLRGVFSWPPSFGVSFTYYPTQVTQLIVERIPWTILIVVTSFFLSFTISYFLAGISAMRRGSRFEFASLYSSILFWSTPAFWVGMILIWVFAVTLGWFPVFGNIAFNPGNGLSYVGSIVLHAVLPILTLTAVVFGQSYFVLRGAAQQEVKSDYVLTAKSRGLPTRTIAFDYVLRNSLLPVISLLGYSLASLISAVILVESVFGYPGVGDLIVDSIVNRDYPVLEGAFFYTTLIVIIGGLLGDFLLLKLDPRLRK